MVVEASKDRQLTTVHEAGAESFINCCNRYTNAVESVWDCQVKYNLKLFAHRLGRWRSERNTVSRSIFLLFKFTATISLLLVCVASSGSRRVGVVEQFASTLHPLEIAGTASGALVLGGDVRVILSLFVSPLRRIPGPWYAWICVPTSLALSRIRRPFTEGRTYCTHRGNKVIFYDVPTTEIPYGVSAKLGQGQILLIIRDVCLFVWFSV